MAESEAEKRARPRMCPQCGEPIVCRCLSRGRAKCPIHGEPLPQPSPPPTATNIQDVFAEAGSLINWLAVRLGEVLAGKPVRDADEAISHAGTFLARLDKIERTFQPEPSPPPADAPAKMWLAYGPVCLHASFFEREDAEEYIEQKVMKPHDWTILEYDLTEPSPPSPAPDIYERYAKDKVTPQELIEHAMKRSAPQPEPSPPMGNVPLWIGESARRIRERWCQHLSQSGSIAAVILEEYLRAEPSPPSAAPLNTKWEGPQGHNAMCGFVTGGECDCGWSAYCDRLISSAELKRLKVAALGDGGESAEQEQNKAGAASSGAGFNAPPLSNEPSPVEPSPSSAAPLEHGMNCRGTTPGNEAECTCGLHWRIQLQTEREMHNAWRKRAEEAERELAERVAPEPATLFKTGGFRLHSGEQSDFKIDCDALTDSDWESLAHMVADRVGKFSSVEGVPQGGLKLAEKLQSQVWSEGPILIVDDVLTTGASMEQQRAGRDAIGAVIFARSQPPSWVTPLFTLALEPAPPSAAPLTVTISAEEYRSLLACAELVRHPDVLAATAESLRSDKTVPFDKAFDEAERVAPQPSTPSAAPDWIEQCAHEIRVWLYGDVRSEDFNVHTEKQVAALIWQRAERVAPETVAAAEASVYEECAQLIERLKVSAELAQLVEQAEQIGARGCDINEMTLKEGAEAIRAKVT